MGVCLFCLRFFVSNIFSFCVNGSWDGIVFLVIISLVMCFKPSYNLVVLLYFSWTVGNGLMRYGTCTVLVYCDRSHFATQHFFFTVDRVGVCTVRTRVLVPCLKCETTHYCLPVVQFHDAVMSKLLFAFRVIPSFALSILRHCDAGAVG